jgi:hypothetical protein
LVGVGATVVTTGVEVLIVVDGTVVSTWVTGDVRVAIGPLTEKVFSPMYPPRLSVKETL